MRRIYNWQKEGWPHFTYDISEVDGLLYQYATLMGRYAGVFQSTTQDERLTTTIDRMIIEALKTSEIEGEFLSQKDLRSSIRNNLGLNPKAEQIKDKRAQGAAELMVACRNTYDQPMTQKMLFQWHQMLMAGSSGIKVGAWRTHQEPMQVISGATGKQKVHFEAPPSEDIPAEMKRFVLWFNSSGKDESYRRFKAPIRSAIAHIYFESLHPYEDGNGRIGRAISEKALSQGNGSPVLLSLSKAINAKRREYYQSLERTQKSLDITAWLHFFINIILTAQQDAIDTVEYSIRKKKFWAQHKDHLNDRQAKVIRRITRDGPDSFEGGLNARKYMAIAKTSKATATRDLQELVSKQIVVPIGGGRSRGYRLKDQSME